MIELTRTSVMNFENAIRGARNPLNSWAKMDSYTDENGNFVLGENDLSLATRLCKAGSDHRKFVRQIFVSVDINAPLYWWKEYDTYKVATVANSTSTMHKIHSKPFGFEDFSVDKMNESTKAVMGSIIEQLEKLRTFGNDPRKFDVSVQAAEGESIIRALKKDFEPLIWKCRKKKSLRDLPRKLKQRKGLLTFLKNMTLNKIN